MKQSGSKYFQDKIYDLVTLTHFLGSTKEAILFGYNNVKIKITRNWWITGIIMSHFPKFFSAAKKL